MEQSHMNAEARTEIKTGAARRIRRAGRLPAVMYGHTGSHPLSLDALEFFNTYKHLSESSILTLHVDGSEHDVLIKDVQEDIVSGDILHVDFYEIEQGKVLRMSVSVVADGTPVGVREGGVLEQSLHSIDVECLPKDIPESIHVDVSGLGVGESVHVSELEIPEGVRVLTPEEYVVLSITTFRVEVEEPEEEEEEEELEEGEEGEGAEAGDEEEESEE